MIVDKVRKKERLNGMNFVFFVLIIFFCVFKIIIWLIKNSFNEWMNEWVNKKEIIYNDVKGCDKNI